MSPVHDYVIDNSTGANVRQDINNALAAIVSNNSSSSQPTTRYAYMWWADTTTGILKIRNSANDGWVELLQLDGTITLENGSASTPALANRSDLNTGVFFSAADTFNVATGGIERMELGSATIFNEDGENVDFRIEGDTDTNLFFLDASHDQIGIGESVPQFKLDIIGEVASKNASKEFISFNLTNNEARIRSSFFSGASGAYRPMTFHTGDSERVRIDTSGRLLIGHTTSTPMDNDANNPIFAVEGSGNGARIGIRSTDASASNGAFIYLTRTRGTSAGSKTTVQSGDSLGGFIFMGADGTHDTRAAIIQASCDGTPGDNDMPGRLEFLTTPDGALNATEKMVIKSTGNVGINVSDPQAKFQVNDTAPVIAEFYNSIGSTNDEARIALGAKSGNIPSQRGVLLTAVNTGAGHNFDIRTSNTHSAGPSTKMRVKNDGNIVIDSSDDFSHLGQFTSTHDGSRFGIAVHNTNGGGGNQISIRFHRNDSDVGSISTTGSATAFNTSSDYRLKENAVAISDGIKRLKTLKPYRFNWKSDPTTTVDGFFAHEVTAVPEAITGTKDEVALADEEQKGIKKGDAIYQSIDQSKLVPLLVAAVQELITKVETLETA